MGASFRRTRHHTWWVSALVVLLALGGVVAFAGASGIAQPVIKTGQGICTVLNDLGVSCQLGTIPAGGSVAVEFTMVPSVPGTKINTATVKATERDPKPEDNTASAQVAVLGKADLVVTKVAAPDPVLVGKQLVYTITITNKGPSTATGVVVTDKLPPGVTMVSCAGWAEGCTTDIAGNTITWRVGTLLSGASATIKCIVTANVVGPITNTVRIAGNEPDPDGSNNEASVTTNVRAPSVDLIVTKKPDKDTATVGDTVTYTIIVTNNGPDEATGVELKDIFSQ